MFKTRNLLLPLIPLVSLAFPLTATAAAPDGFGPWADKVVKAHQGLMKNGQPVPAIRSDSSSALGVAENDTVEGHFYSLGFGGKLVLGFKNGIKNGVVIVEATNSGYPTEKAKIEVSPDKDHWYEAGTVSQDGQVSLPKRAGCIHYVRIKDISNPSDFTDATADGYDVDGVKGEGEKCSIKHKDHDYKDWEKNKDHDYSWRNYKNWDKDWKNSDSDGSDYWGPYSSQKAEEIDNGE